jgi:serine/threonine protein phosphatase PrpC
VKFFDQIEHASRTDVGVRRNHNQDSCTAILAKDQHEWREKGHVFMVADGMGAHAVGEMASAMACQIIPLTFQKHAADNVVNALRKAFAEANSSIHERGQANKEFQGMGTTGTALILRPDGAWLAHCGDSRAYRIRNGVIEQLSFDHSLLWEKARRQGVKPEELTDVPHNVIVRSLGPDPQVETDIQGPHPLEDGDIFLLCSDGLSGPLTDPELGAVAGSLPPKEACHLLVDLANLRGGPDNISVVIARVNFNKSKKKRRDDEDDDGPSKPSLLRRIPWPLSVLLLGFAMAGGAAAFAYFELPWAGFLFLLLAALAIAGGIVGLFIYQKQERERAEREPPAYRPRLQIYRQTQCLINDALMEKLQGVETALLQQATEKQWELDWDAQRRHHGLFEKLLAQGNLAGAFRECCRAVRPLTEALAHHRNKEEKFQPNWDKTAP